jgi:hypothetical protein
VLAYPRTSLAARYCDVDPDATVGQGRLFFDQVTTEKAVHHVGAPCSGEKPWPSALPEIVADTKARCTPRHTP